MRVKLINVKLGAEFTFMKRRYVLERIDIRRNEALCFRYARVGEGSYLQYLALNIIVLTSKKNVNEHLSEN